MGRHKVGGVARGQIIESFAVTVRNLDLNLSFLA